MALYSNTLQVIRHYLATSVGDLIYGQAGTSGSTITKINATFLWKANDYYKDNYYEAYVYAGVNIGETRRVVGWVLSSKLLEIHTAYDNPCNTTSYVELHRIFTEDEYRKAINQAIAFIANDYYLDAVDVSVALSTDTYETAMPTSLEFQYVHRITRETTATGGKYADVDIINPDFYRFILVSSVSYIKFDEENYKIPSIHNNKDLRIEGQKRQATLTSDTGICYLPLDWIIAKAITFLPSNKIQSGKLDKTLDMATAFASNIPLRGPYPKSKRVIL